MPAWHNLVSSELCSLSTQTLRVCVLRKQHKIKPAWHNLVLRKPGKQI
jgi:hypothetical protein